jgi:hypothetical protein
MLSQPYREVLIRTVVTVYPDALDCRNLVEAVRPGSWAAVAPLQTTYLNIVTLLVASADDQNWLRDLVQRLVHKFAARSEFAVVLAQMNRTGTVQTGPDPFQEVLLEADRPFVNRHQLRSHLLDLTNPAGSAVLLVDGEPQTGKSFSFYLINHVGPKKGFIVNKFDMSSLPEANEVAEAILGKLGISTKQPLKGRESAERWAENLADTVAHAIVESRLARLFVFDGFTDTPLPEGTASLLIRLATYADEHLRPYLRVVMMRFRAALPIALDDVALRDYAQPFTGTDMVAVVMQIAKARSWSVTELVVKEKIEQFLAAGQRTLNERFKFLRTLVQELAAAAAAAAAVEPR